VEHMLLENVLPEHMLPDFLLMFPGCRFRSSLYDYKVWRLSSTSEVLADMGGLIGSYPLMPFMLYAFSVT
jgi:hypothetical protein